MVGHIPRDVEWSVSHCKPPFAPKTCSGIRCIWDLAGIQRVEALSKHSRLRLPITPPILHQLNSLWPRKATSYEAIILWATCCVCFFGFFRLGELIPETPGAYNSDLHMRLADVAADLGGERKGVGGHNPPSPLPWTMDGVATDSTPHPSGQCTRTVQDIHVNTYLHTIKA